MQEKPLVDRNCVDFVCTLHAAILESKGVHYSEEFCERFLELAIHRDPKSGKAV